jgi:hypothetical protein
VADELIESISEFVKGGSAPKRWVGAPKLEPGRKYNFGHKNDIEAFIKSGDAEVADFCLGRDWHVVEDFGRWMREKSARLEFSATHSSDDPITVMVGYQVVPWVEDETQLRVSVNQQVFSHIDLTPGKGQFLLLETVPEDGKVVVDFQIVGRIPEPPETEKRKGLCLGLISLSYAAKSDLMSRVALIEVLLQSSPNITKLKVNDA